MQSERRATPESANERLTSVSFVGMTILLVPLSKMNRCVMFKRSVVCPLTAMDGESICQNPLDWLTREPNTKGPGTGEYRMTSTGCQLTLKPSWIDTTEYQFCVPHRVRREEETEQRR